MSAAACRAATSSTARNALSSLRKLIFARLRVTAGFAGACRSSPPPLPPLRSPAPNLQRGRFSAPDKLVAMLMAIGGSKDYAEFGRIAQHNRALRIIAEILWPCTRTAPDWNDHDSARTARSTVCGVGRSTPIGTRPAGSIQSLHPRRICRRTESQCALGKTGDPEVHAVAQPCGHFHSCGGR